MCMYRVYRVYTLYTETTAEYIAQLKLKNKQK